MSLAMLPTVYPRHYTVLEATNFQSLLWSTLRSLIYGFQIIYQSFLEHINQVLQFIYIFKEITVKPQICQILHEILASINIQCHHEISLHSSQWPPHLFERFKVDIQLLLWLTSQYSARIKYSTTQKVGKCVTSFHDLRKHAVCNQHTHPISN